MCASGFPGKWLIKPCPCNLCSLQCKRLWGQRIGKGWGDMVCWSEAPGEHLGTKHCPSLRAVSCGPSSRTTHNAGSVQAHCRHAG